MATVTVLRNESRFTFRGDLTAMSLWPGEIYMTYTIACVVVMVGAYVVLSPDQMFRAHTVWLNLHPIFYEKLVSSLGINYE